MTLRGSHWRAALMLLSSAVFLAALATGCQAADEPAPVDWAKLAKQVCRHNKKIQVQSISDMLKLIAAINKDDQICEKNYLSAIYELDPILKLDRNLFCSEEAFELMKNYHFRFIQPFKRANRMPTQFEPLPYDLVKKQLHPEPRKYTVEFGEHKEVLFPPIAFRHFFLKFALQVSAACKKDLIVNLKADADRVLTDSDREIMQMFDKDSPIGVALGTGIELMNFDSVLHIPELDGRLIKANGEKMESAGRVQHLKTSAREDSPMYQMIYACKHRFKPLYDRLIMPIVRLSKLGYDYQGDEGLTEREQAFLKGDEMRNWLVIVHVCEIFKNTHLIRADPKPKRKTLADHLDEIEAHDDKHEEAAQKSSGSEGGEPQEQPEAEAGGEPQEAELKLSAMTDAEVREAEEKAKLDAEWLKKFAPIDYEPSARSELADKLMIESERQLDHELAIKYGGDPNFFVKILRQVSNVLKMGLAKLDFERFAHYRRHSLFYAGLLNFVSACSNVASVSVTLTSILSG